MENEKDVGIRINAVVSTIDRNTGKIKETETLHNIVTDLGLERIARRLFSNSEDFYDYIAIGTGTTTEVAGDVALETEVARELAGLAYVASNKAEFTKVFTFGSAEVYDITEAGIFDDAIASGSSILNRLVFAAKSVDIDTSLSVTITLTFARL